MTTLSAAGRTAPPVGPLGLLVLDANTPRRFYRGGARIAAFRGATVGDDWRPEDWVGSTTTLAGGTVAGLTTLPGGGTLRDAVVADPAGWLGPGHVARFGADTAVLVKLLDAGERLPVHCHPDDDFAGRQLGSAHGKTESWVVLDAAPDAVVHLGLRRPLDAAALAELVRRQDRAALLDALVAVPVRVGDTVLVPAGLPHSIGAGVLVLELQQPTDLSVLLERAGFTDAGTGDLGLGDEIALACVDRSGWDSGRVAALLGRVDAPAALPAAADPFFRLDRVLGDPPVELEAGFAVLVGIDGEGRLDAGGTSAAIRRGSTVLAPYAAGPVTVTGRVTVLRCRPPAGEGER